MCQAAAQHTRSRMARICCGAGCSSVSAAAESTTKGEQQKVQRLQRRKLTVCGRSCRLQSTADQCLVMLSHMQMATHAATEMLCLGTHQIAQT